MKCDDDEVRQYHCAYARHVNRQELLADVMAHRVVQVVDNACPHVKGATDAGQKHEHLTQLRL